MSMRNGSYYGAHAFAASQFAEEEAYWVDKLSGDLVKTAFPCEYTGKSAREDESRTGPGSVKFSLSGELFSKLMKLSSGSDAKLHMILAAGLSALLYRYTGAQDITVGTVIYKPDTEGEFINTVLTLRNRVAGDMPFKQLLINTRQTVIEAVNNVNYPIERLLYRLNMPVSETDFPLFDTAILLENIHDKAHIRHIPLKMMFSFLRKDNVVEGKIEYNPGLYKNGPVTGIADHYILLLQRALDNVGLSISRIDMLSEEEKKQFLLSAVDTGARYPADKTIQQLFEEQARKTPDNTALFHKERRISYGELNRQANRLAGILRKKGVVPDTIVGIMMERSPEMMAAIWGVLKAGGAYLPLDPDTPKERALLMLEDCAAPILLTKSTIPATYSFMALQSLQSAGRQPYVTAPRPQVKNFDALSFPDRSLADYEKYHKFIGHAMVKNSFSLQATRGCPYRCAYCHKIWPKTHIVRSAENLLAEICLYYNLGVRRFAFIDDIFNHNRKNSTRFFELIIEKGLDLQLFFPNGMRGDALNKEYIDLMVEAGTVSIALALETASPRLQRLIGKNLNLEKMRENIEYLCEKHPHVILELNTMHGFPTETEEEARMTLDFLKSLKWIDFPYINILKIYPNTDMAQLALENGVSAEDIERSEDFAYHELPDTLPFDKSFTQNYQSDFLNTYFLSRERLLDVLPHQVRVLTEDELVQKYNSYLPTEITSLKGLLDFAGIKEEELGINGDDLLNEDTMKVPGMNQKLKACSSRREPAEDAFKVLLLDLSQFFSRDAHMLYDVVEPPLGLMYLLTYLEQQLGNRVRGKIAKSRIDFDNYRELKNLVEQFKPDVIGIRTLTFYKDFFHKTAAVIRNWGIDVPVIAGGPYATSGYNTILQDMNVDLVVLGEGEITFAEVIEKLMENGGKLPDERVLEKIRGVAFQPAKQAVQDRPCHYRQIIMLDTMAAVEESGENPEPVSQPTDVAYVLFTSGSTGRPKGVMVDQRGLVNYTWWAAKNYVGDEGVNFPLYTSIGFDLTVTSIFTPLITGNAVVIYEGEHRDVLIEDVIDEGKVGVIKLTPSHLKLIKDKKIVLDSVSRGNGIPLKRFILGGEAFDTWLAQKIHRNFGQAVEMYNEYGPTEATVGCMIHKYDAGRDQRQSVPIGLPADNMQIYLLDAHQEPVPVSVTGEIYIAGDGIARGYVNAPELTKERFVEYSSLPGQRLYRSGDIARWLPDGNMEFLGRIDQQVKIRGFRIELGEIESQLSAHKQVKEALVIARDEAGVENVDADSNGKYLAAYIVPSSKDLTGIDITGLKNYLSKKIPGYMVPGYFIEIPEIPLTANGKLDRKSLPEPELGIMGDVIGPRSAVEMKLAEIWAEVLGVEKGTIGIDNNFFKLGGHSLRATLLIAKIHKAFNVKIKLVEIFTEPTIRRLAEYIEKAGTDRYDSIEPAEEKDCYSQSSAQKRLFFLQYIDPESTVYNLPFILPLENTVDKEKLEKTFHRLILRHDSLRTSFDMSESGPIQEVHGGVEFSMGYIELRDTGQDIESLVDYFVQPFNLKEAPLLRAQLVKTAEGSRVLMLDMHHIVTDGVSQELIAKDVMALYRGDELPPLKLQYKDFSQWQAGRRQGEVLEKQRDYWANVFAGELAVVNLPTDYPRPLFQSFAGSMQVFSLDKELTAALYELALKEDVTLYMILLAVFDILLAKLSGSEDIVVGTPVAGRRHADFQHIVGMFVNTLALRSYPAGGKTFKSFLRELRKDFLEAFENQEYQFEDLVEDLDVPRDTGRNPLFDVMFSFQEYRAGGMDEEANPYAYKNKASRFDLTLAVTYTGERLGVAVEYCTRLFKENTIERFVNYFRTIAAVIVENPGIAIEAIEIVTAEEKKQLLVEFNDTRAQYPGNTTIHEWFEQQVEKTPERIAVSGMSLGGWGRGEITFTYRELNETSNRVAYRLMERGTAAGHVVGIMVERSLEMVVGILGILKAGAAYLPIDTRYPLERVRYILKDSSAGALLAREPLANSHVADICPVLCLEDPVCCEEDACKGNGNPHPVNRSSDMAYVIYTSGSTGKPKGVIVEHGSILNTLLALDEMYPFFDTDVYLLKTSFVFDVSLTELFGWFFSGGRLAVLEKDAEKDPAVILRTIEKQTVTHLNFVPSMFNAFVEHLESHDQAGAGLDSLKYIFLAGEAILPEPVIRFRQMHPGVKLENIYGPTEASIYASWYSLGDWQGGNRIPIGKPLPNVGLYILDKYHCLLPPGVVGELCIDGAGIARGYLNRPELTAEKFFSISYKSYRTYRTYISEKLYKTGDLACWLPDGNIEFLGRMDHQVKIRGFRVELGEIENRLSGHDKIKEAAVLLNQKILCAYIVSDREVGLEELKEYLAEELPGYMVPSHFVKLEKLPLNASGKIDRGVLSQMESVQLESGVEYAAPGNPLEEKLVEIWEAVIGQKNIGIHDKFFMLGGDSIKAIQVVARLNKEGYKVAMRDFLLNQTIAKLAPLVKRTERCADQSVVSGPVPLTPIQKKFFREHSIDPHHYTQAVIIASRERFSREAIKFVLQKIQEHHDALRMTYGKDENGEIIQTNMGLEYPFDFQIFDFLNCDNAAELMESKSNEIQSSINLETGPLMKSALFHLDDGDRLLIAIHRLVIDGISWRILLEDIETLYTQYRNKQKLELPPKTDSFKVWAERLSQYAGSDLLLKEQPYWTELETKAAAVPGIKKDFDEKTGHEKEPMTLSFSLGEEETELLLTTVNEPFGTKVDDILVTALGLGIKETFGCDRLVIALNTHHRQGILEEVDVSRTLGWFSRVYPVLLDFSNGKIEDDLSRRIIEVKETLHRVPGQGIGYGVMKYLTPPEFKESLKERLFNLNPLIVFDPPEQHDAEFPAETRGIHAWQEYELDVEGHITGKRLVMSVIFNKKHYKIQTIRTWMNHFEEKLKHIISHCSSRKEREISPSDLGYKDISIDELKSFFD